MKNLILLGCALTVLYACNQSAKNTANEQQMASQSKVADSTAIADAIHGFYKWYDRFSSDSAKAIDFTNDKGKHLILDIPKLEAYLANFTASGFVNADFIADNKAYYQKCAVLWQKEEVGDVPSGMDADKFFCAQDWEIDFWIKSPVRIKFLGTDKATVTMYGTEGGSPKEHSFELKKENGKWLLSKIECDMGI